MEIKEVFMAVAVAVVCVTAVLTLLTGMNANYTIQAGGTFNNTLNSFQSSGLADIRDMGVSANNSIPGSGDAETDEDAGLIKRGRQTLSQAYNLMGVVPSAFTDGARILRIPGVYAQIAGYVFTFVFVLMLAYLFITGVRTVLGR